MRAPAADRGCCAIRSWRPRSASRSCC
jgi:hypothetical protein